MTMPASEAKGDLQDSWRQILSHAVAAPSPLNTQPWRVLQKGPLSIDLFIDTERLLPLLDPTSRQGYLSCGAFLENLEIAAREAGFRADVTLFPTGWPGAAMSPLEPVARIELIDGDTQESDHLFSCLHTRHTNRRMYTDEEILPETFSVLASASDLEYTSFGFSADLSFRQDLAGYLAEAMEIALSDPDRLAELLSHVRIIDPSWKVRQEGYGSAELGLSGITGWLSRMRIRMHSGGSKNRVSKDLLIRLAQKQAGSAAAFGWIATKGNVRYDQVRAGRAYERVHLTATSQDLSLHAISTILESFPGMEAPAGNFRDLLGIPDTHTVQMLFRLGYSHPGHPSKRRAVQDFVWSR